jgi:hypothetical protein
VYELAADCWTMTRIKDLLDLDHGVD